MAHVAERNFLECLLPQSLAKDAYYTDNLLLDGSEPLTDVAQMSMQERPLDVRFRISVMRIRG